MRILDRYLAREFLRTFVFSLAVFLALSAIVDLFDRLSRFLDVSGMVVIQYYFHRLPWFGFQVMPIAVLLAALFSLGKMARNNELLAMKMGRLSSFRIVVPLLVLGLMVSLAALILGESIIPRMNERALDTYRVKVQKVSPFQRTKNNDIWYRAKGNRFLHISLLDAASSTVQGFTLFELSPDFRLLRRIDAKEARWQGGQWWLRDGNISWTRPDGAYRVDHFTNLTLNLEEKPTDLARVVRESEEMTSSDLREYIERLAKTGVNSIRYQVDLAAKGSTAFTNLVMALIGIAFALRTGKRGVMAWTGACVVVAVCYSILNSFSISLGRGGVLPPLVSAWLPNALFTAAGLSSVLTVKS
ncbi:MAG: LPS export ABC transporter permease LptG [candidate division NC10 bacterium]|nr:LPS export ABC transporter permease LptG [candidate division NC10 bacterium]MDE2322816.1 LPS export ABC transporter permease LptG [candidate division NC10 bacterium]